MGIMTPTTIYLKTVIPAEAGIHDDTGFRVKPGTTAMNMFTCRSINVAISRTAETLRLLLEGAVPLSPGRLRVNL
jgi:hypothetical protein